MDPILLQKQVRDNAEDLQNCLKDLKNWESEMKRKERELSEDNRSPTAKLTTGLPPVRNKLRKTENKAKQKEDSRPFTSKSDHVKKISGFDYASWDKFDVDKACEQVDAASEASEEDTESEEEDVETERLRDEAMYEKEKGNQFVKNQKWTNAIECYTRAIECYPYDAVFYANRALCYLKTSDLNAAEADCTSALSLDISYVKAFLRRSAARMGLGLLEEAKSDLEKVLTLEPNNSAAKSEIAKIEKKIGAQKTEKKASGEREEKVMQEKKPSPRDASSMLLNALSKSEPSDQSPAASSTSEREKTAISEAELKSIVSSESEAEKIHPVYKPPHLRSKKPLQEIGIKVINEGLPKKKVDLSKFQSNTSILELQATTSREQVASEKEVSGSAEKVTTVTPTVKQKVLTKEEPDDVSNIPPPANTYIDFYAAWNKVRRSPQRRFLYLKQIPGASLPKIFGEALEATMLSELIETLETSFLPHKELVYPYVSGISNVKRLSALTLFMNNVDKTRLETLLDNCERLGECTKEEALALRKKFEL